MGKSIPGKLWATDCDPERRLGFSPSCICPVWQPDSPEFGMSDCEAPKPGDSGSDELQHLTRFDDLEFTT